LPSNLLKGSGKIQPLKLKNKIFGYFYHYQ